MAINWTLFFKKYKGKWLALKEDEKTVVGIGITANEALVKAQIAGYKNPILTKIPLSLLFSQIHMSF